MTPNWLLLMSLTPYLAVMAYDIWLHANHRKVPPKEQRVHHISVALLSVFVITSVIGLNRIAAIVFICTIPVMLYDEVMFHKMLSKHERAVHSIAGLCLLGFIAVWIVSAKFL